MNKIDAIQRINEASDADDIVVAIFPRQSCDGCGEYKQTLHARYASHDKKWKQLCWRCLPKEEKQVRRKVCGKPKKSQPKLKTSSKREMMLKTAVSV